MNQNWLCIYNFSGRKRHVPKAYMSCKNKAPFSLSLSTWSWVIVFTLPPRTLPAGTKWNLLARDENAWRLILL